MSFTDDMLYTKLVRGDSGDLIKLDARDMWVSTTNTSNVERSYVVQCTTGTCEDVLPYLDRCGYCGCRLIFDYEVCPHCGGPQ